MVYKNFTKSPLVILLAIQVIYMNTKTVIGDTRNFEKYIKKHGLEKQINLQQNVKDIPVREFNGFADGSVCKRIKEGSVFTLKESSLVTPEDPMFDLFWSILNIEFNASGNLEISFKAIPIDAEKCDLEISQTSEFINTIKQKVTMKIPDESLTITQSDAANPDQCELKISDALGSLPIFNPEHLPENIDPRWFFCHQYIITANITRTSVVGLVENYTVVVTLATFDVCPNPETIADAQILEMQLCVTLPSP